MKNQKRWILFSKNKMLTFNGACALCTSVVHDDSVSGDGAMVAMVVRIVVVETQ
jgi:hypothetical protein